jgi:hypothetical protein
MSGTGLPGSDAPQVIHRSRRDWSRLRRQLPGVLAAWIVLMVAGYFAAMRPPADPSGALGWALSPLGANAFSACRAAEAPQPIAPNPPPSPSKASLFDSPLFISRAEAQEAVPNQQQQQQQVQEPQQQQQQQQLPEQNAPDSGSTGGGFSGPFDIPAAVDCDQLGFGDLIDVAMDVTGEQAWVINRYGQLYHSGDGGRSWERQGLPDLPETARLSAVAADDQGKRVVVAVRLGENAGFDFYGSSDGGLGWRRGPAMTLKPDKAMPVMLEVTGLAIGSEAHSPGTYVVVSLVGDGPEAVPAVWLDRVQLWSIGYQALDAEMVHRLRTHDFGAAFIDLGASGPSDPLPIASWERWQGDNALRLQLLTPDSAKDGALTANEMVEYVINAGNLRAIAASDDGRTIYGAEAQAILRGRSIGGSWSRIDLRPLGARQDFALRSIDVAKGDQAIMAVGRNALFVSQDGGATFFQPSLTRYPAPWFYLVLLSGPVLAFYLMRPGKPETMVVESDESKGLSDRALSLKDPDALNLRSYAEGLSGLLRNTETRPPLVVGITGPWGSGKSSVMQMLSELLTRQQMPVVWFNAWHHQSEEHLLASLLSNIRRQGIPGMFTRPGLRLRWRLTVAKLRPHEPVSSFLTSWLLLILGVALVSGALALWLMPPVSVATAVEEARAANIEAAAHTETTEKRSVTNGVETVERTERTEKTEKRTGDDTPKEAGNQVGQAVAAMQDLICDATNKDCNQLIESAANLMLSLKLGALITLLLGLVPLSRLKQVALVTRNFDPGKLMTSVMPSSRNPKLDEQLSFRHGFGEELRATIGALAPYRLVIFIDDLDRCRPENVAAVLEAVNFVVSAADCYVVLGMDRAYVLRAIRQEFEKFIEMEKAERKDPALGSPEEDKGRPRDFAEHYLEKLVNLIVAVPKMTPEARGKLMESLASKPPRTEEDAKPRFDWLRWGWRVAGIAVILAALLGPVLYVASLHPPAQERAAPTQPVGTGSAAEGNAGGQQSPAGATRTVTPLIPDSPAGAGDAGAELIAAGPLLLVLCGLIALIGIAWASIRAVSVPANLLLRDSKAFKTTLRKVESGLAGFMTTPRRAKRFVNRLRLFSAMLRSGKKAAGPEHEAELDRATVQAGALHALARELMLAEGAGGTPPADPAERTAWDKARKQAEDVLKGYRDSLNALYGGVAGADRHIVNALYWRFWQLSDGASLGDAAIVQVAERSAPGGNILIPVELDDDDLPGAPRR